MKIHLVGMGCERRLLEFTKLRDYFIVNGYKIVSKAENADYIFLITCAFKKKEEEESIKQLKDLKRLNKRLIVYGCLPGISPSNLIHDKKITYLLTKDLWRIDHLFDDIKIKYKDLADPLTIMGPPFRKKMMKGIRKLANNFEISEKNYVTMKGALLNALKDIKPKTCNLFICRGCLGDCSYCAIRYSIGKCKSKTKEMVLNELTNGVLNGYTRYKLMGDDVGAYGIDINTSFGELLLILIKKSKKIQNGNKIRYYIEGIHPRWVIKYQNELEDFFSSGLLKKMMCPIQSGNDRILGLMHRHHNSRKLSQIFNKLNRINPRVIFATQIMVGFPSENSIEFLDTLKFLDNTPIKEVTIFPYNDKNNTPSYNIANKVSNENIDTRLRKAITHLRSKGINVSLNCPHSW